MYTSFSEVYDRLMNEVDYAAWATYYGQLLRRHDMMGRRLCECACGTGSLTIPLTRQGFEVTGVDLSAEMLDIAGQKARKCGLPLRFIRQDMRKLALHQPVDAVIATCDGVNYLLTDGDVKDFFRAAYQNLTPGGVLAFDVSTPWKLKNVLGNELIVEDREDVTYLWQNSWNGRSKTVSMALCFFLREADGRYRRIEEQQKQKAHEAETLLKMLAECGFEGGAVYGDRTMEKPGEKEQRWHIAARKPL